ncbi:DUF3429 domain-containing protein [Pseudomonas abietaniphila]|uniref:DUF3429 domain-containing protein n=1 Tax=Pseudomonas abietaniphila TaxID=89065 RepID=A0A1G7ZGV5_9PSED|nr:DUF3429 domain-containing protein [Pseudomonas abietaniphila]SDH07766.1 Protein of unknown function [Pseudomonas abietaniphila]
MKAMSVSSPPRYVGLLGYGGLLPFLGLLLLILFSAEYRPLWTQALLAYGAVILSFVGALHWGFAMTLQGLSADQCRERFIWSVIPALIAWPAMLLAAPLGCLLLIFGFVAHYWQDRRLVKATTLPAWYLPMRLRLTLVASLCLLLGAITVAVGS